MSHTDIRVENAEDMSIKQLEKKILELSNISSVYNSEQQSIKECINSMYGVFANQYFYFFDNEVAESVTGQGRNITVTTEKYINTYFLKKWHLDIKLHKSMGLTKVDPISGPVSRYCDTDSVFISLSEVYDNTEGWSGNEVEFILELYQKRIHGFMKKCFQKYSDSYNADNMLNLELEKIAYSGLWLAKKKYVLDMAWEEPNIFYEPLENVKPTGGELKQSSTPKWLKKKLTMMVEYILSHPNDFNIKEFLNSVHKIKEEFKLQEPEVISNSISVNNYENYVLGDTKEIELKKGCPYQVRAAAYYNWILNYKRPDMKTKYRHIASGNKIKFYIAKTGSDDFDIFAYHPNEYPYEFAPDIDYDAHFDRAFIQPLNRFLEAIGQQPMSRNLLVKKTLF